MDRKAVKNALHRQMRQHRLGRSPACFIDLVEVPLSECGIVKADDHRTEYGDGGHYVDEIQHIGIAVSKANGCPYCTAAFCTILNHGLGTDEATVKQLVDELKKKGLGKYL